MVKNKFGRADTIPQPEVLGGMDSKKREKLIKKQSQENLQQDFLYKRTLMDIVEQFPIKQKIKEKIKEKIEDYGFSFPSYLQCIVNTEEEDKWMQSLLPISVCVMEHVKEQ